MNLKGHECNDCHRDADPQYTMDFTDISEGYIYWCDICGPIAHNMNKAINNAFKELPGFAEEFKLAIERAKSGGNQ